MSLRRFQSPQCEFLIPDEVAHEIILKPDAAKQSATDFFKKLLKFLELTRERFWLAKPPGLICQRVGLRPIKLQDLIHVELTLHARMRVAKGSPDVTLIVDAGRSSSMHAEYQKAEGEFDRMTREFRDIVIETSPEDRHIVQSDERMTALIRSPTLVGRGLPVDVLKDRKITEAQLSRFPDIVPLGRWSRLIAWYGLLRTRLPGGSKNDMVFSNCYADASCAFLASYTGHLATNDKGLQTATRAVCPHLSVWEWEGARLSMQMPAS